MTLRVPMAVRVFICWAVLRRLQLAVASGGFGNDLGEYFSYARSWADGQTPYLDYNVEFPPFLEFRKQRRTDSGAQRSGSIKKWSGVRESDPRPRLGKPLYYHCTNPARRANYTSTDRGHHAPSSAMTQSVSEVSPATAVAVICESKVASRPSCACARPRR